jgi:hypothetical protein
MVRAQGMEADFIGREGTPRTKRRRRIFLRPVFKMKFETKTFREDDQSPTYISNSYRASWVQNCITALVFEV